MLVIDCSVTMAWLFEDEKTHATEKILDTIARGLGAIAPSLWLVEVSNVLLTGEKSKRLSQAQVSNFWKVLASLPIKIHAHTSIPQAETILHLAREHHLTTYDATYLDLAMTYNAPLATLDKALIKAAKHCGVVIA